MTYEWAKPGVKVVCVIDSYIHGLLQEGKVYEIREVLTREEVRFLGKTEFKCVTVRLVGFKDVYQFEEGGMLFSFNIKRFRPLIDKRLPDSLTILLEKPNRLIVPSGDSYDRRDGGKWDVRKTKEKEKSR